MRFKKKFLCLFLGLLFVGSLASCANTGNDTTAVKEVKFEDVLEKVEANYINPKRELDKTSFLNTKSIKLEKADGAYFQLTVNQEIKIQKIEFDYCYDELIRFTKSDSMYIRYTTTNERLTEMKNIYEVGAYEDNKIYHVVLTSFEEPICKKDGKIRFWFLVNPREQNFSMTITNFTVTLQQ